MKFAIDVYPERFDPSLSHHDAIEHSAQLVELAEQGGFAMAVTAEHHTIELHIGPNPFLTLAHWAGRTSRIRLASAVVIAPYWHPIRLAGESAYVDNLSNGRLEVGIGRGAYQYEFDRMFNAMDQLEGGEYLRELVPLLRQLWKGDVAHDGKCWNFPRATAAPKPLQQNPPLWIAARSKDSMEFAVKNGCNVMANPFHRPFEEVVHLKKQFDEAVEKYPQEVAPKFFLLRRTCVYDSEADRRAAIRALMEYGTRFENLYRNLGDVHDGFPTQVSFDEVANKEDYTEEALMENLTIGTPDQVIEKLRAYEDLGIDFFGYGSSYGLPHDVAQRSVKLFSSEVIPAFESSRG